MAAGALLSITLVPVLMIFFVKGKILPERKNPINRFFIWLYRPILSYSIKLKYLVIILTISSLAYIYPLYTSIKWEFMPMLNEQSFMYMPVTPYGISIDQAKALTQKTDAIIKSFPEVQTVFGKAGRANSATDPAPLSMIESIIVLKPQSEWREGMSYDELKSQMNKALSIAGLINSWTYPIRGRIDMLMSGIRTPLGIKLYGKDPKILQEYSKKIENSLRSLKQTLSIVADQANAGYYLDINIDQEALKRYALTKDTLLQYTSLAIGGMKISTMYKGLERYDITLRLEDTQRDSIKSIQDIPIKTKLGFVPLGTFAKLSYRQSASVIKSEMATPVSYIYITPKDEISPSEYKDKAKKLIENITLPAGYYLEWAGQSEYLDSAMQKIVWIIPAVLISILILIYFALKEVLPTLIVFFTLPFAFLGGLIYLHILDFSISIAVVVGFLALLGVAAETAIVMIVYLQESLKNSKDTYKENFNILHLNEAIYEGAVARVRPKLMTVFSLIASLTPIMYISGVGSEVMQRIAAPMLDSIKSIQDIPIKTKLGFVPLGTFAKLSYRQSASVIKSEMATPVSYIYITPKDEISPSEYKDKAKKLIENITLPAGYYLEWAGQSEYLDSAMQKIVWIIPAVLISILILIYFALKEVLPTLIVFFTLPFAFLGGLIYLHILDFSISIAVVVGFLALLGVAAETAIVMIVYLQESLKNSKDTYKENFNILHLNEAIYEGAVARVRPKLMTVFSLIASLTPIMYIGGVGSEVMQRIAAPMLGGIISSAILSLVIIPILFEIYSKKQLKKGN
jgi:Cu/Ag efflux pump CusA